MARTTSRQRRVLLATIIGSGVVFLDGSVVNLALPKIAHDLHIGFSQLQWIVDGYLLTLSALILLGGSLGDIFGRKRVYLIGMVGFALSSLLCGVMPSGDWLIAARLLQGMFGALMVPGALAIIASNFSAEARGKAVGQWTAATSAIIVIGPLLGGYILDVSSWRWIFYINLPLLIVSFWVGRGAITETARETERRVDWGGAVLAVLALAGLTFGLIEGPSSQQLWPWLLAIFGVVCAGLFVWYERRVRDPMLDLRLFQSANFTAVNLVTLAMYGALGGFFFALTIYLQTVLHFSSLQAGASAWPVSVLLVFFSGRVGAWSSRYGPRLFLTAGPMIAGLGMLVLLPLHEGSAYWTEVLPGVALFGLGMSLLVAPLTATLLNSVERRDEGIASGVNNAISRVAGLLVVALLGLAGASHAYQFAAALCGGLAIGAGIISFVLVRQPAKKRVSPQT